MDRRLAELVEELTTSGEPRLEPGRMKELKKICRSSEEHISHAYHLLVTRLNEEHAEVDFQDVHARTVAERRREEEKQKRLDNIYKEKAKRAEKEMEEMSQEIADTLTEMENSFCLLMPDPFDFTVNDVELEPSKQISANEDRPASPLSSQMEINQSCFEYMDDEQPCCSKDVLSVSQCVRTDKKQLDEKQEKPEQKELDGDTCSKAQSGVPALNDDDYETFVRNHGLISHKYTLDLEISTEVKVHENEDNTAIINNVMDAHKLVRNKFLPSVQSWIQLFTRAGINDDRLRCAIDLKNKLETAMKKYKEMNISFKARKRKVMKALDDDDDSEDDDEFVEVPEKEGYEPHIPDHLRKEYGLEPQSPPKTLVGKTSIGPAPTSSSAHLKRDEDELDPTCAAATLKLIRDKLPKLPRLCASESVATEPAALEEPDCRRKKLEEERAKAPFMPFGLDLHYWGQNQPSAGKILKFASEHRFWAPSEVEEEVENTEITEMLKTRYITFAGKFEPVKHKCRAPMPDGSLCERQDRIKCPFHGKIVPRDDSGIPINAEDRAREEKMRFEKQAAQPEWRDPEFMREVEAATGVDLGSSKSNGKGGKKKGKKKKYPNLTDLKQQANTSRSRLEKKVFNKGAVKRVVKAMNRMDQRKHEKFANQFNYALN
ncbi:UV-stimulated scaffold protein A isoform X2 [Falco biarmicus]|uniref:UV-stimulated scaffold protein A isoform X2 n=1 Tax=Falco rusticolus TaxID=120794 RepID=UPI0018869914|nr:UV-stimulated scaffold protein A isoform X2 [Falco rusticolus]XP_055573171.1 UV-stimulated scaffold protein A isoform X2 [Falco cherrug]XP_055651409.1 UV-stimulated scaffold protein A isoform X2 [Falco peregrinus]XP_056196538.1 UV-stimulated scaffold protein A isoform X2 [Falco biarmicus]